MRKEKSEKEENQTIMPPFEPIDVDNPAGTFDIFSGITATEMNAMFFDEKALVEPPYKIWQLNSKGHRYYYRYSDNGVPEFYPSVTTILSQTLPKSPFLIKWIADKGIEESERYKGERAAYGTFMHAAFENLLINRFYDLDGLKDELKRYIEVNRLPDDFIYYVDDLKKDVLAFAQFVLDYDVRPLAVEISLVHPYHNYAGMIDCPCTMLERIGGTNRINAIVDFKSGRKGFYEDCEIQLGMYRDLWNINFENVPINRIFNFSPKDWRKKPTYNLKEQTESPNIKKIPYLLELAAIEDAKKDNVFTLVNGVIMLDSPTDLSKNVVSLTLSELVKAKKTEIAPIETIEVTIEKVEENRDTEREQTKKKVVGTKPAKEEIKPHGDLKTAEYIDAPRKTEKPAYAKETRKNDYRNNLLDEYPEI